jgi:hypothetical protein
MKLFNSSKKYNSFVIVRIHDEEPILRDVADLFQYLNCYTIATEETHRIRNKLKLLQNLPLFFVEPLTESLDGVVDMTRSQSETKGPYAHNGILKAARAILADLEEHRLLEVPTPFPSSFLPIIF